jgi:ATP/ADP translocase
VNERWSVKLASITGFAVVAAFVAGKAARDAMFLTSFRITLLPTFAAISAVLTLSLVLLIARRMTARGPATVVPFLFATSAVLLVVEWAISDSFPHVAGAAAFLHLGALGPILVSGFWSTINERFDPRTAKHNIGRIGLGATLGGIAGGLVAQGTADLLPARSILLVVAAMLVVCIALLRGVAGHAGPAEEPAGDVWEGMRVVARSRLLRTMANLTLLLAISAAALDYAFKAQIASSARGPLGALGIYYTVTNVVTALVQLFATDRAIARIGVGRSAAILPGALAAATLSAVAAPVMLVIAIARGTEMVARSSVYRAATELLMSPLAPRDKRSAKVMLDVGADRVGDMLGAQLVGILLLAIPSGILVAAAVFALVALGVALAIPRAYRNTLEERLVANGSADPIPAIESQILARELPMQVLAKPASAEPKPAHDVLLTAISDLRSGERLRVERVLGEPLNAELAVHVLPLVAWSPVSELASSRLRDLAPRITGQLVDALLDPETDFDVRRKLPAIIAVGEPALAGPGLWRALSDQRFEVRYRVGKALARMRDTGVAIPATEAEVFDAVEREVRVDTRIWRSYRLLDGFEGSEPDQLLHRVLEQRSATALDHVFTLLGLALPAEPLHISLHALGTDDAVLRGTALEYLEGILPPRIRDPLWPFLELDPHKRAGTRSSQDLVAELKLSHPSILANLRDRVAR